MSERIRTARQACLCLALWALNALGMAATVHTADGELYYEVHGEGPPIILVAGGPGA